MHVGRNISRLRSFRGIKQDDIAKRLKMTQQNYSLIENSEHINDEMLEKIAEILGYDTEYIKNMPEVPYVYSTNQSGGHVISGNIVNYDNNPVDKIIELYERMLSAEKEKSRQLEETIRQLQAERK